MAGGQQALAFAAQRLDRTGARQHPLHDDRVVAGHLDPSRQHHMESTENA
jgi:hypothetical protein